MIRFRQRHGDIYFKVQQNHANYLKDKQNKKVDEAPNDKNGLKSSSMSRYLANLPDLVTSP